jgi:cofilin
MASGVGVADDIITKFQELKLGHSLRYIICKLNSNSTEVVVEKSGAPSATYQEFLQELPSDDCRYAVYDFEFSLEDGGKRNKILFVLWAPDSAKIKNKMLYTSSKADLKKKLVGIATEIQATDASEIDYNAVLEKVSKDVR